MSPGPPKRGIENKNNSLLSNMGQELWEHFCFCSAARTEEKHFRASPLRRLSLSVVSGIVRGLLLLQSFPGEEAAFLPCPKQLE